MEVFFLKERFKDLLEISRSDESVVQDRSIYEGVYVFTENNYAMGNLDDRDYETYMELFEDMTDGIVVFRKNVDTFIDRAVLYY